MTEKRFKLRLSQLGNGMITDREKGKDLYFDKKFLDVTLPKTNDWLNELSKENEQLKQFIKSLASPDGRIWLDNGYGYRIDKVLNGDVE